LATVTGDLDRQRSVRRRTVPILPSPSLCRERIRPVEWSPLHTRSMLVRRCTGVSRQMAGADMHRCTAVRSTPVGSRGTFDCGAPRGGPAAAQQAISRGAPTPSMDCSCRPWSSGSLKHANEPASHTREATLHPYRAVFTRVEAPPLLAVLVQEHCELLTPPRIPASFLFSAPRRARDEGVYVVLQHVQAPFGCAEHLEPRNPTGDASGERTSRKGQVMAKRRHGTKVEERGRGAEGMAGACGTLTYV
jgi:hypothetical protein